MTKRKGEKQETDNQKSKKVKTKSNTKSGKIKPETPISISPKRVNVPPREDLIAGQIRPETDSKQDSGIYAPQEDLIAGQIQPETVFKRGPRKKRKKPELRISNHKARASWFQARTLLLE